MARDPRDRQKVEAATYFMARAEAAMAAAEDAGSDLAMEALCREAETWLYMAGQCLNPGRPPPAPAPAPRRLPGERRSFVRED